MKNLKNCSILILAAGKGRRLKNIGKKKPKCLIKINNRTLLEILIENLKKYGAKEFNIVLGYKKDLILKKLNDFKEVKFKPIYINNYSKYGHGMSWYSFKNRWKKNKKPLLIIHGDIFFNHKFLRNLINSKKINLIGVKNKKKLEYKPESMVVSSDKKGLIKNIGLYKNISDPKGEALGINKFSVNVSEKIFNYMSKFLKGKNKLLSWEFVINRFIADTKTKIFMLFKQNYFWVNINTPQDLKIAKRIKKV